jgi:hypothetical protein
MIDRHRKWIALAILVAGGAAVALVGDGRRDGSEPRAKAQPHEEAPRTASPKRAKRTRGPAVAGRTQPGAKPAARAPRGEVVLRASWGSGVGELGRSEHGAPEGPMSFAVDDAGRMHVLDQVNARIQVFEKSEAPRVVPLPSSTYQDLALTADGGTVVVDQLGTGTVGYLDASGEMTHSIPIAGPNIDDPAAVTALFAREDGTWLEVEHQHLVRIADARGEPDPDRPVMPGRFSRDGSAAMRVAMTSPTSARLTVEHFGSSGAAVETTLAFDENLLAIRSLDSDLEGRAYVVVDQILEDADDPDVIVDEHQTMVVVGEDGKELERFDVEVPPTADEQKRPITIDAHGAVFQLVCAKDAAMNERFAR